MNKTEARRLVETITNEEKGIKDWTKVSLVNKGMSKGTAWNILAKDFDIKKDYHRLAKLNMLREFGEYLTNKPMKKTAGKSEFIPVHQEPDFSNYEN